MRMRGKLPIFNNKDTWDLSNTLAPIISTGLKKFKEQLCGSDFGGYPCDFETPEEWHKTIDKMILAFEYAVEDVHLNEKYWKGTEGMSIPDKLNRPKTPEMLEMWGDYMKELEERQNQIEEGLELFSKHFQSLWW